MAGLDCSKVVERLTRIISEEELEELARECGVFRRRSRKLSVVVLVWVLLLGSLSSKTRSITGLHQLYRRSHQGCAYSSFHDRLASRGLLKLLKLLFERICSRCLPQPRGRLELVALDSTIIRLWEGLHHRWPGTHAGQAGFKLQMVYSLLSASPSRVKLRGECSSDQGAWKRMGKWVKGCILLMDRGYEEFHLFYRIEQNGGFFLTPLKAGRTPLITANHRKEKGNAICLVGKRLNEVVGNLHRAVVDVQVQWELSKRSYRGQKGKTSWNCRLIGLRKENGEYWWYLTNLSVEQLAAEQVWSLYRMRWQVELLFKRMRQFANLGEVPSQNPIIAQLLLMASLCAVVLSARLRQQIQDQQTSGKRISPVRFDRVIADNASLILEYMAATWRTHTLDLELFLLQAAYDPNRNRPYTDTRLHELNLVSCR